MAVLQFDLFKGGDIPQLLLVHEAESQQNWTQH